MDRESEFLNRRDPRTEGIPKTDDEAWRGIPGLTPYEHIRRIRKDRINRWLGPDGVAVATEKFDWNKSFAPVIEQLRRTKEEELLTQKQAEADQEGVGSSDVMTKAEIARQVNAEIAGMFNDVNALYNTISRYRDRLEIITSGIPTEFQNIAGVKGADNYFLVQAGTREENETQIFRNFESLNNAGGNTKLDRVFSHRGGVTEGHDDKDFFGWKLTVGDKEFIFVWNPDETGAHTTEEEAMAAGDQSDEPVDLSAYRRQKQESRSSADDLPIAA